MAVPNSLAINLNDARIESVLLSMLIDRNKKIELLVGHINELDKEIIILKGKIENTPV